MEIARSEENLKTTDPFCTPPKVPLSRFLRPRCGGTWLFWWVPRPWADPKSRSTLGLSNLHHRSTRAQNCGGLCIIEYFTILLYHTIPYYTILNWCFCLWRQVIHLLQETMMSSNRQHHEGETTNNKQICMYIYRHI